MPPRKARKSPKSAVVEKAPVAKLPETFTRTIRMKVVKPVELLPTGMKDKDGKKYRVEPGSWDKLGSLLFAYQAPLHRPLNGIVTDLEIERRQGLLVIPWSRCYQLAGVFLDKERTDAARRVEEAENDKKKRAYAGDDIIAQYGYSSALRGGIADEAYTRWLKFEKDRWKGKSSLPEWGGPSPIIIKRGGIELRKINGDLLLTLDIGAKGKLKLHLVVSPYDKTKTSQLLKNPDDIGIVRLLRKKDRETRQKTWQAMVSFKQAVRPLSGEGVMAIHRGIRNFLTVAIDPRNGRPAFTMTLAYGHDILEHKRRYEARRRSLGQHSRELGAGARGHGEARRREHINKLLNKEARTILSKCQQVTAKAIYWAKQYGVSTIHVEDWANPAKDGAPNLPEGTELMIQQFPFSQLRSCIESACVREGILVVPTPTDYNSWDCPSCGHRHETARVKRFVCDNCMLDRDVDFIFVWNMLLREGSKADFVGDSIAANVRASQSQKDQEKGDQTL